MNSNLIGNLAWGTEDTCFSRAPCPAWREVLQELKVPFPPQGSLGRDRAGAKGEEMILGELDVITVILEKG